jgi:NitT/TauT family transport system substrate-binding protein
MQEARQIGVIRRRTFLSQMVMGTGLALGHWGCQPTPQITNLRIGINDWIGYAIARYAQKSGIMEKRGLQVDLIEFMNLQDATRAMLRGSLDASFSTIWDLMSTSIPSVQPVILLVTDVSNGSDGIVARYPLQSMKDLQGKRVGVKLGTVNELILLEALKLHQISPNAIKMVDISNEIAATELRKKKIDAAVMWQPLLSEIAEEIQGAIVYTTKDQDSLILDILATTNQTFQDKKTAFRQFIWAWFDTMAILKQEPEIIFQFLEQELSEIRTSLIKNYAGLKPGNITLNRQMLGKNQGINLVLSQINDLLIQNNHSQTIRPSIIIPSDFMISNLDQWKILP